MSEVNSLGMELRARDSIRPPGGLYATLQNDQKQLMQQAKRRRAGKKSSITKRIKEIKDLVSQRGSRTKIKFLKLTVNEKFKEAVTCHEELMLLLEEDYPDFNDEWIENLHITIDTCMSEIELYLQDRKDDPPSTGSHVSGEGVTTKDIHRWRSQKTSWLSESSSHS